MPCSRAGTEIRALGQPIEWDARDRHAGYVERMELREVGVGGGSCVVRLGGPSSRHSVVLLPDITDDLADFDGLCERLHNSDLRTIVVEPGPEVDEQAVAAVMNSLELPLANLVGRGTGADLAWRLVASDFDRFVSLIVVGRGHPAVADLDGVVAMPDCRPIEVATTMVIEDVPAERRWADRSGRLVYGDFRVVPIPGAVDIVRDAARELATEIVLRTSLW